MNWRRLGALAGMAGPVIFVTTFLLQGWLRPGFESLRMTISDLALGPTGWIQSLNFIVYGVLIIVFARGIAEEFSTGRASWAGPILLTLIGIGAIGSGVFVTDPATTPPQDWSWQGLLHVLFSLIYFVLSPVVCFVFLRRFREDPRWKSLAGWTLLVGIVIAALAIAFSFGAARPPAQPNAVNAVAGLIERANAIVFAAWQFAVALNLHRLSQAAIAQDAEYEGSTGRGRAQDVGNA